MKIRMLARLACALLVLPMAFASSPVLAAGGFGRTARPVRPRAILPRVVAAPQWQLKVNGAVKIHAKAGEVVTFTLRGDQLSGATAVLAIKKNEAMEVLPFLGGEKSTPMVLKLQMPTGEHMHGGGFNIKVIGKTRDGTFVESNSVRILWAD